MVEDRIRQKNKQAGGLGSALGAFATHGSSSSTAGSNSNGNGNGHSSSSQSISVPANNQSTAASKRNVVLTSNNVPATSFTSPDRGSRESYENSPSPFRLEITPPQSEAGGDHTHNVSTVRAVLLVTSVLMFPLPSHGVKIYPIHSDTANLCTCRCTTQCLLLRN